MRQHYCLLLGFQLLLVCWHNHRNDTRFFWFRIRHKHRSRCLDKFVLVIHYFGPVKQNQKQAKQLVVIPGPNRRTRNSFWHITTITTSRLYAWNWNWDCWTSSLNSCCNSRLRWAYPSTFTLIAFFRLPKKLRERDWSQRRVKHWLNKSAKPLKKKKFSLLLLLP